MLLKFGMISIWLGIQTSSPFFSVYLNGTCINKVLFWGSTLPMVNSKQVSVTKYLF